MHLDKYVKFIRVQNTKEFMLMLLFSSAVPTILSIWQSQQFCAVSIKHDGSDGTPNRHCANDKSFEDKHCCDISRSSKVHIICPCFGVDTFTQF